MAPGLGDPNFSGINELGTGGSGSTHVYNDAGTHTFTTIAGWVSWHLKVVTAP